MTHYRDRGFEFSFDADPAFEFEATPPRPRSKPAVAPKFGVGSSPSLHPHFVSFVTLDKFAHESKIMPAAHNAVIKRIAHLLVASPAIGMPIREIELIGHADFTGTDKLNVDVGSQRAQDVAAKLRKAMNDIQFRSADRLNIAINTRGEAQPVVANKSGCVELNRRVEVRLPATCQTFFADYDLQSYPGHEVLGLAANPNIPDKARRLKTVMAVVDELGTRLDDRAKKALGGHVKDEAPLAASNREQRINVAILSELQLGLMRKYFPGTTHGFSLEALHRCFQKFANGEMRSPHKDFKDQGVNEPDSSYFFLFAEFGWLCVDSNIDKAAWEVVLRALVGAQEVFMHVYRKDPVSPPPAVSAKVPATPSSGVPTHPLENFKARNFKPIGTSTTRGKGQSDAARLKAVTEKYSGMGIGQLRAAAAQNLLRAQMF